MSKFEKYLERDISYFNTVEGRSHTLKKVLLGARNELINNYSFFKKP